MIAFGGRILKIESRNLEYIRLQHPLNYPAAEGNNAYPVSLIYLMRLP